MSFDYCAEQVRRGDPDRFLSAMTAPVERRGRLMALYAFNLEVARIPWVTTEPQIAEMRLQFWIDSIEGIYAGRPARKHELLEPLAQVIAEADLPKGDFQRLLEARQFDLYHEPHETPGAFESYIDATSGGLMRLAAAALTPLPSEAQAVVSRFAFATGVANLLRALPALLASRRIPIPGVEGDASDAVRAVARDAKGAARDARRARGTVPAAALPALLAGWRTDAVLGVAESSPQDILSGGAEESEFRKKATLLWRSSTGRW